MINLIKNEYKKNYSNKNNIIVLLIAISTILIYKYTQNINSFINTLIILPPFISIITSFSASSIISKEITEETFKTYLTKPKTRTKVIISKIIYLILLTMFYEVLTILLYLIIILLTNNNIYINDFLNNIKIFLKYMITSYFIVFLTTFLSVIFRNSKFSSTLITILLITNIPLTELLFKISCNFIKYTFIPYLDLSIFYNSSNTKIYNINLEESFGILILITYSIIFIILSISIFNKKDIKS